MRALALLVVGLVDALAPAPAAQDRSNSTSPLQGLDPAATAWLRAALAAAPKR